MPVDPFDFRSCFEGAVAAIRRHRRTGHEVQVNVSGGTKILADAALLAAFQEGVDTWHCEDRPVRLPVLRGVTFSDWLTRAQHAVLNAVDRARPVSAVVKRLGSQGYREASVQAAVKALYEQGLVRLAIRGGRAMVSPEPDAAWFVRTLK